MIQLVAEIQETTEWNFQEELCQRDIRRVPKFEVKEATPRGTWINDNRQLDEMFRKLHFCQLSPDVEIKGETTAKFSEAIFFFSVSANGRTLVDSIDIITPMEAVSLCRERKLRTNVPFKYFTNIRKTYRAELSRIVEGIFRPYLRKGNSSRITPGPLNGKITFLPSTLHHRQILARSLVIFCFFVSGYYLLCTNVAVTLKLLLLTAFRTLSLLPCWFFLTWGREKKKLNLSK